MAVDMGQVRAALDPEEPDYPAAARLGADAMPHLETLIGGSDASLAAKAAYLAGLIGGQTSVAAVAKAARSSLATVRIAAAAAAKHLTDADGETVLLQLVDDADPGVQKVALRSVPVSASDALRSRVVAVSKSLAMGAAAKAKAGKPKAGATKAAKAVKRVAKTAKKPAKTATSAKKSAKKAQKKRPR